MTTSALIRRNEVDKVAHACILDHTSQIMTPENNTKCFNQAETKTRAMLRWSTSIIIAAPILQSKTCD